MMKKLFSLLLCLCLLTGLCLPALAADTDALEETLLISPAPAEPAEDDVQAWIEYYDTEYPEWRENYKKHAPYAQWGCDSIQEVMAEHGFATEAEAWDWLFSVYIESECFMQDSMLPRVAAGGPAFGIGVQWMGEFVVFPDAKPVLQGDRTMVPVRAFMEQAGAQVDYTDGTVVLTTGDGTSIRFRPGEATAYVNSAAGERSFAMDAAPFIAEDRTYVPLRFFSEALGYEVYWDNANRTAVILDRAAVVAALDENFTVINSALAALAAASGGQGARQVSGSVSADVTVFDSIDGDKTAQLSMALSGYGGPAGVNMTVSVELREYLALLLSQMEPLLAYADAEETAAVKAALESLGSLKLQVIEDTENGVVYIQLPQALGALYGAALPENCYVCATREDLGIYTEQALTGAQSVGGFLYDESVGDWGGIYALEFMLESAEELRLLLGDDSFQRVSGGYALRIDETGALYEMLFGLSDDGPEVFNGSLNIADSGTVSGALNFRMSGFGETSELAMTFSFGAAAVRVQYMAHEKNVSRMDLTLELTSRPYSGEISLAPGADAVVLSAEELAALLESEPEAVVPDIYAIMGE